MPDGTPPKNPGEYSYMPYSEWEQVPSFFTGDGEWHIVDPTGLIGAIGRTTKDKQPAHTIEVHDTGRITCSPSLVMPGGWHGFLIDGVFSE